MSLRLRASSIAILGCSLLLAACGDDTTPGGDAGTGGSDTSGGGSDTGGTSGAGGTSGSGGTTGGSTGDGGGGALEYGSGTITMDFNGTPVTFEVWQARFVPPEDFIATGDSVDSTIVDSVSLTVYEPTTGTFDCSDSQLAVIDVQAENSEGETDLYDSQGASTCTITVTEYGAPGEPVRGTFAGELRAAGSMTALVENGTFDLIRGSD